MDDPSQIRNAFFRHLAQTSPAPVAVQIDRAEGVWLYAPNGEKYLDLISGISVSNLGHRCPEVVEAVKNQLDRYMHTMVYGELILAPQVKLAELLSETLDNGIDQFYFVNSGSEAVEGALKLAKRFTGRSQMVAFHHSYHGSTHGALSVTGSDELKNGYGPFLPGVRFIRYNEPDDFSAITQETACVIAEPLQAEAGVIVPDENYFRKLKAHCESVGALLILDEIQTAYGRMGSLFAHTQLGIVPDILLLAKGIGGGMPLAAFGANRKVMTCLSHDPILGHITTFGGHPVNCAAGIATLKKIVDEKLWEGVAEREKLIRDAMKHSAIQELRGKGLLFAVDLGNMDVASRVMQQCISRGVFTDFFLHAPGCLRIAPPLVISMDDLAWGLDQFRLAIDDAVK